MPALADRLVTFAHLITAPWPGDLLAGVSERMKLKPSMVHVANSCIDGLCTGWFQLCTEFEQEACMIMLPFSFVSKQHPMYTNHALAVQHFSACFASCLMPHPADGLLQMDMSILMRGVDLQCSACTALCSCALQPRSGQQIRSFLPAMPQMRLSSCTSCSGVTVPSQPHQPPSHSSSLLKS